jgi:hypothetical protein
MHVILTILLCIDWIGGKINYYVLVFFMALRLNDFEAGNIHGNWPPQNHYAPVPRHKNDRYMVIIIIIHFLYSSRYPGDGGASYTTTTTASGPVVGEESDPYLHTPPANHSMAREAYQPSAPAPTESYQPSAAAGINRYPGLAMEQRKMHLAGDYYRSQVNLQQQQQQQQQLEKPADMLAHDHYLGESKLLYLTSSDWLYRLHTAILDRPPSSAATMEVQGPDTQ